MAKKIIPFGMSPTDDLVKLWLESKGIDSKDVMAYGINRSAGGTPTIQLTMFFDESALTQTESDKQE